MQHREDFFVGHKGAKVFRQAWLPEREALASILIVHGLAEHSGRYQPLVEHFVPRGYAIYGFDHYGHGRSEGPRCHADSLDDFSDNLRSMVGWVKAQQPGKKLFLFGHSMGGLISANYLIDHQRDFAAAVLSAPAVMSPRQPSATQKLKVALLKIFKPQAGFAPLELEGVSRDPTVVQSYRSDPLVHKGEFSVGLALVLGSAMSRLKRKAATIQLPVLIIQGEADRMVHPDGAKQLYQQLQSSDKELRLYPGAYHELLNEPEAQEVLRTVERFFADH